MRGSKFTGVSVYQRYDRLGKYEHIEQMVGKLAEATKY
jgi:hypothetical protein